MDEVRRIVKPGGCYYYKTIMKARVAMEKDFRKNFNEHFKDILEKSGLSHPNKSEFSLDNPQFYSLDLRFDADIPDRFDTMETSFTSSEDKEKSNISSSSEFNSISTTDSTLSSLHTAENKSSISEMLSVDDENIEFINDGDIGDESNSNKHTSELNDSSRFSLEEGEICCDEDLSSGYLAGDLDNNTYCNSKKRKLDDLQNGNIVECEANSFSSSAVNNDPILEKMECFQCELCGTMKTCESEMKEHLISAEHFAASKVCGTFNKGLLNTIEVVKESCIKNQNALYKTIVPMCPVCHQVYSTIYVCAMHFRIVHNFNVKDCYSVGKVTREETITNINSDVCSLCNKTFSKSCQLKQHWEAFSHFPFSLPKNNEVVIFFCPSCHLISNNFLNVVKHIQLKHFYGNNTNKHVLARYVEKSSNFLKVVPSMPVSREEQKRVDRKKIVELGIHINTESVTDNTFNFLKDFGGKRLARKLERRKKMKKRLKMNKSAMSG